MPAVNYFWDGDNLLQEYDDAGNTLAHYVTEPGQFGNVISQRRDGQTHQFHYDGLGSTMELTNGAGNVTDGRRYSAFGSTVDAFGATAFGFMYVGRLGYYDDAGVCHTYVRRRTYSPSSERWLSADPRGLNRDDMNLYNYARNRPLLEIDPSGLAPAAPFEYGNFCGPTRVAVCIPAPGGGLTPAPPPANPAPIDALDAACAVHDCCLAPSWWEFVCEYILRTTTCDATLCTAIAAVNCSAIYPNNPVASYECDHMKQKARNAFC